MSLSTISLLIFTTLITVAFKIFQKISVKKVDPVTLSILCNIFASVLLLPFVYKEVISFIPTISDILLILFASFIWAFVGIISIVSIEKSDVSLREPLLSLRIVLVAILGFVFLNEQLSRNEYLGIVLIFSGILMTSWQGKLKFDFKQDGYKWVLLSVVATAIAVFVDKIGSTNIGAEVYAFYIFLFSGIFRLFSISKYKKETMYIFKNEKRVFLVYVLLLAYGFYGGIKVITLLPLSIAYPILQFASILTILAAIIFLGERKNIKNRILGSIIATLGVILFRI